jgi:lipopolysaccharide transport system ATP-binding protein
MKPILEVQNISKKFRIQTNRQPYLSLRESITGIFSRKEQSTSEFWALKDVSFDVYPGDSVGIIGRNGAGKSTLLKILSKITPPTSGKIISRGRIASLLEVGTGFHPELTGRENIYLNGSILGLKRHEINQQFDAIVDFSGVEKFLDTPLKHYSSGMQLRLAFAVAAHMEPEVLIIDEVLAVGDAEFQKKCMGKMGEVSKSGRTILFVSHQIGAITQLCQKGVLLNKGGIENLGDAKTVVDYYLNYQEINGNNYIYERESSRAKKNYFTVINTSSLDGTVTSDYKFDESVVINFEFAINSHSPNTLVGIGLNDKFHNRIATFLKEVEVFNNGNGLYKGSLILPSNIIAPNKYTLTFAIWTRSGEVFDMIENVCHLNIYDNGTDYSLFEGVDYGSVILDVKWNYV